MTENLSDAVKLITEIIILLEELKLLDNSLFANAVAWKAHILSSVLKQMMEQLTQRKTNKYLFDDIWKNIREMKIINKIEQDIKI